MKRPFHLPAGTRMVSSKPALDWDRYLAEATEQKEKREALIAENEKHYAPEMTSE